MTSEDRGSEHGEPARVVWFELRTPDIERSARFYTELFGWQFSPFKDYRKDYWLIEGAAGGLGGALVASESSAEGTEGTTVYVEVEDLARTLGRAQSLDAAVLVAPTVITHEAGVFAIIADPCGTPIGLWAAR